MSMFRKSVMMASLAVAVAALAIVFGSVSAVEAEESAAESVAVSETKKMGTTEWDRAPLTPEMIEIIGDEKKLDQKLRRYRVNGKPIDEETIANAKLRLTSRLAAHLAATKAMTIAANNDAANNDAAKEEKSLTDMLYEFVASKGKSLHVDRSVLASLDRHSVVSPSGEPPSLEDIVRTELWSRTLVLVPIGNMLTIVQPGAALHLAPTVTISRLSEYHPLEIVKCVIPCSPADASAVRTALNPFISRDGVVTPIPGVNCLLLSDTVENVQGAIALIESIRSAIPENYDPRFPNGKPEPNESRLVVVDIPTGLSADVVTSALTSVLGLKGQLSEDGRRYMYMVHSFRQEEDRAKQVAQALKALQGK